jgi:hypothetical protein
MMEYAWYDWIWMGLVVGAAFIGNYWLMRLRYPGKYDPRRKKR